MRARAEASGTPEGRHIPDWGNARAQDVQRAKGTRHLLLRPFAEWGRRGQAAARALPQVGMSGAVVGEGRRCRQSYCDWLHSVQVDQDVPGLSAFTWAYVSATLQDVQDTGCSGVAEA